MRPSLSSRNGVSPSIFFTIPRCDGLLSSSVVPAQVSQNYAVKSAEMKWQLVVAIQRIYLKSVLSWEGRFFFTSVCEEAMNADKMITFGSSLPPWFPYYKVGNNLPTKPPKDGNPCLGCVEFDGTVLIQTTSEPRSQPEKIPAHTSTPNRDYW